MKCCDDCFSDSYHTQADDIKSKRNRIIKIIYLIFLF